MTTAYVTDTGFNAHTLEGHVESAARLKVIHEVIQQHGIDRRMLALEPIETTEEQLLAVHTLEYLDLLRWTEKQRGLQLGPDTYVLPQSFAIARLSAGAAVRAVDAVMSGEANNAFSCARPPGHHATPKMGMGFCLLSNIAIAARHAQKKYGVSRVLIVDYDVHHGNGTQDVFYDDPSVMFVSTHQYLLYPGTGALNDTGTGAGKGYTVNVPIPALTGDEGFVQIFDRVVWPVARRFKPELIMVSAGFDTHWQDPLAQVKLSLKGIDHNTRELIAMAEALCGGKIVFALEGGYNLTSLSNGAANVALALLGDSKLLDPLGPSPVAEVNVTSLVDQVVQLHGLK